MPRKRYVIVGDGAAGITAAEALRRLEPSAVVAIYTDDPSPGYFRAALTNYLLGELREDQLWAVPPDFYEARRIHRIFGRVVSIDTARSELWDSSGAGAIAYDHLLIATGARPRPPMFAHAYLPGVMMMRTVQDVRQMVDGLRARRYQTATVLGGGPLGLEWAHGLREQGIRVTIIERAPRLLPKVLDETASHLLATRLVHAGIEVVLGEEVASAYAAAHGGIGAVTTNTGRAIACDLVAVAAGVIPNTEIVAGSGVTLTNGGAVRVSRRMQSSVPNVWAAGDCASVDGEMLQLWEPARLQGRVAGENIAGRAANYHPGAHYFATRLFDLDFASVGDTVAGPGDEQIVDLPRGTGVIAYRKLVLANGKLKGALMVGERNTRIRAQGRVYKRLIDLGVEVGIVRDRLLDRGFDFEAWRQTQRLVAPPASAVTPAAGPKPAKARGTQQIDLRTFETGATRSGATSVIPSSAATSVITRSGVTSALPASAGMTTAMQALAGATAVLGPRAAEALKTAALLEGGERISPRSTRQLSIGLQAEAPAPDTVAIGPPIEAWFEGHGRSFRLGAMLTSIGRSPQCEIAIDDSSLALLHAQIMRRAAQLYLRDMGSRTGTFVNGEALTAAHRLVDGDRVRVGTTELVFRAPGLAAGAPLLQATSLVRAGIPRIEVHSGHSFGLRFGLRDGRVLVGRAPECVVRLDELELGWHHATIRGENGRFFVADLGTPSGTFVAGARLEPGREERLREATPVRFGSIDAIFTATVIEQPTVFTTVGWLEVDAGADRGRRILLAGRALVGSQPGCDLVIGTLQPVELEIVAQPRGFELRAPSGRSSAFVGGSPVGSSPMALNDGDMILLGSESRLRFEEAT